MNGDALWLDYLFATFEEFSTSLRAYIPTLVAAVALLLIGWLIARLIKLVVLRIGAGLAAVMRRSGVSHNFRFVRLPWPLSIIVANVLYWLVVLLFVSAVAGILGLPGAGDWFRAAISYLPRLFGGAVILLIGYVLASFLRDLIEAREDTVSDVRLLGRAGFLVINAVAVVVAVDQIGIHVSLVQNIIVIAVAASCGGAALAFGLGAGGSVDNIIAAHYARKTYQVGQRVRIGDMQGEILEMTPTAVIIDIGSGRAQVPAKLFGAQVSILLTDEE